MGPEEGPSRLPVYEKLVICWDFPGELDSTILFRRTFADPKVSFPKANWVVTISPPKEARGMLTHLKIFLVDQIGEVVVITPGGDGNGFRYNDLHSETNAIRGHMMKPGSKHLVVDLSKMDYFGSEFIGALVSMLREVKNRGHKASFCSANPQMMSVLQNMSLFKLWPHHATRDEAVAAAS